MTKQNLLFSVLALLLVSVFIISCSDESSYEFTESEMQELNLRHSEACEIGNYSVQEGMLYFPTVDDYHQTLCYLSKASKKELLAFDNTIPINTVSKEYRNFQNWFESTTDENLTSTEIFNLWEGKVLFVEEVASTGTEYDVRPLVPVHTNITNLNGVYKVQTTVIKQAGGKFINITKPGFVNINSINGTTTTNPGNGVYVNEIELRSPITDSDGLNCTSDCSLRHRETNKYAWRRRVQVHHEIKNTTTRFTDPLDEKFSLVFPAVEITNFGRRQKRKWHQFWGGHDDDNIYYNIDNEYNWHFHRSFLGSGLPDTPDKHMSWDENIHHTDDDRIDRNGVDFEAPYSTTLPNPRLHACLKIDHDFEDDDGDSVSYDCD